MQGQRFGQFPALVICCLLPIDGLAADDCVSPNSEKANAERLYPRAKGAGNR